MTASQQRSTQLARRLLLRRLRRRGAPLAAAAVRHHRLTGFAPEDTLLVRLMATNQGAHGHRLIDDVTLAGRQAPPWSADASGQRYDIDYAGRIAAQVRAVEEQAAARAAGDRA